MKQNTHSATNIPLISMEFFFCFVLALSFFTLASYSTPILFNISTDEYALLAFKNAITSDPHSVLSHNWSSDTPICNWIGISCAAKHRRVAALNLSGLHLEGTIPPHLGNLTFLQSLDLSSNNFTGFIPPHLSNLRRLKELNLGINSFASSEIPPWLGHLSQLRHLYLNNNTFSGSIPLSLCNLSYLETLNLVSNKITGSIPNGIFNMSSLVEINMRFNELTGGLSNDICSSTAPKLKRLYLSVNQLSGELPANIYKCRKLEDLRLAINNFSGTIPPEIGSLSMLTNLSLYSNHLSGSIPPEIGSLSMLTDLYLHSNHFKGHIPNEIGNLTSLKYLYLRHNYLTGALPQELGNLLHLEELGAGYNSLSGSIPSSIFNLSALEVLGLTFNQFSGTTLSNTDERFSILNNNLQKLYLGHNKLSGEILNFITSNATNLIILCLHNNSLSGPMPNFGNLRLLQQLFIWGNQLNGAESPTHKLEFFSSFTNCRNLKRLEISNNPLNGTLPTSIGNLSTSLQYFNAAGCNIKGVIPFEIKNLSSLIGLGFYGNQMTGSIPRVLGDLKKLQLFDLSYNMFRGDIPTDLCKMTSLETLSLSGNMLTGPIPNCVGEVKSLRHVDLASNKLDSIIPSDLWNLKDLLILNLSSNYLRGQLSSQIGNLMQVYRLDLSSNQFVGDIPSQIDTCESLQYLSLSNNKLQGSIPKSLGNVRGLTTLDLSSNNLSGFISKSLENLQFLEYFNVSYNKLEGEIPNGIVNSTAQSFVHNSALCGAARFQVPPCPIKNGRSSSRTVALTFSKYIVPPFIFIATAILVVVVLILRRRRKLIITPPTTDISLGNFVQRRVSYLELVRATTSFSETNLLGIGSFGSVYKATLFEGLNVAVKVFNIELEGATKSFDTETEILSSIRHRNLLPVIGCCTNQEFRALILKYMPNGSLEKWLHSGSYVLDLVQRLDIATDVALALEYLHHGHTFPVVHCDIKPSNVLLDEDMTAHVCDFGISKLFDEGEVMTHTTTLATIGYAAPEYGSEGKVSTKGDVYSYGILLLEMFTQKKPTDDMFNEEMSLKDWVEEGIRDNAMSEIVAPGLVSREDQHWSAKEECVSSILEMAMKCLAFSPHERIDMIQVGAHIHKIKAKVTSAKEVHSRYRR